MNQNFKLKIATQKGENIAKKSGDNSLPIDLLAVADKHNILIEPKVCPLGVSGILLRHGNSFGIMYSTYIKSEGFQRFSIAHELGHYFLEGHLDHILPDEGDGTHQSSSGFVSSDSYEMEADYFASGLLMPSNLIQPIIRKNISGLSAIKKIAESCKTSLISSAIRYTSLSEDAVAVIVSKGMKVDFCFLSQSMKSLPELVWPTKKSPVPTNSLTAKINKNQKYFSQIEHEEDEIDVRNWLSGNKLLQVKEEVQSLGSYGKLLTVLSYSGDIEEVINNEEDKLINNWKMSF